MSRVGSWLRRALWRALHAAGYSIVNVAKEQDRVLERATETSREKWGWLGTLGIGTLVDVGANTGQFARAFLEQRPGSLVYSFEPLEDCFQQLQAEMGGIRGFTAFNVALGDSEGEVDFYRSQFSPSSSLLPMGRSHKELFPHTTEITSEKVTMRMLDSFSDRIVIRGGLLIKIDVQGAEAQVLKGGRRLLSRADAVIAEVGYLDLYDGQATIGDIAKALTECGLTFVGVIDQTVRSPDSLPVYGDALFVRRAALERHADQSPSEAPMPWPCSTAGG